MQSGTIKHCVSARVLRVAATTIIAGGIAATFACANGAGEHSALTVPTDSAGGEVSPLRFRQRVASVIVTVRPAQLAPGQTATANATAINFRGDTLFGRTASWSSSNTNVARVSSTGVVTAVASGTARIVATVDLVSGSATVTVGAGGGGTPVAPVATVTVSLGASTIQVGGTTTAAATMRDSSGTLLTGRSVAWSSSTPTVANVSTSGVVTGVGAGTAFIVATSEGIVGQAQVSVTAPPSPTNTATQLAITTPPPTTITSGVTLTPATVVQLRDASGAPVATAGVVVSAAAASGTATLSGTLSAITNSAGAASFSSLVLTGTGSSTLRFSATGLSSATSSSIMVTAAVLPPPGGLFPPNIIDNASFETGFDGFLNTSLEPSPTGVTRDCTTAADGSCSVKRAWVPASGDVGSQFLAKIGSQDHVWVRFYFKLTSPVSTIMKFARFYDSGINTNFGGLFLRSGNNIFSFGTDQENMAVVTTIGLTQAQVIDGRWHSLEFEYWRNGDPSGFPSAAFWFDGTPVSMPDGPAGLSMFWKGGRLYAGQRNSSVRMSYMEWVGTLNGGNNTTGSVNLDKIAISSAGRIGP